MFFFNKEIENSLNKLYFHKGCSFWVTLVKDSCVLLTSSNSRGVSWNNLITQNWIFFRYLCYQNEYTFCGLSIFLNCLEKLFYFLNGDIKQNQVILN